MRKFRVKAMLKKPAGQYVRQTASHSIKMGLEREFEIPADEPMMPPADENLRPQNRKTYRVTVTLL